MKVTTFKITATNTFVRPTLISNGYDVTFRNIIIIPYANLEYRGGAGEDVLTLNQGVPMNLSSPSPSGGFPFEIRGTGIVDVITQG